MNLPPFRRHVPCAPVEPFVGREPLALDAAFSGITNIDRGTAHGVETVIFSDLEVGSDGTFARGQSGARIQGGFYGPGHTGSCPGVWCELPMIEEVVEQAVGRGRFISVDDR